VSRIQELEEKLIIIGMRERCLELTQELATVKQRAEKAEARVKELEARCKYLEAQADCFVPADQYFEERRKGMWK